jgi:DNA polymerase III subunit epsilon
LEYAKARFGEEKVEEAVQSVLYGGALPPHITRSDIDALPDSAGIYTMYGETGSPIYIGKSKNIRERVISHFRSDIRSPKEMRLSLQVHHIEFEKTAGDLSAQLLESTRIKVVKPLFNRQLRESMQMTILKTKSADGEPM